jgi:hypothetical protein
MSVTEPAHPTAIDRPSKAAVTSAMWSRFARRQPWAIILPVRGIKRREGSRLALPGSSAQSGLGCDR